MVKDLVMQAVGLILICGVMEYDLVHLHGLSGILLPENILCVMSLGT